MDSWIFTLFHEAEIRNLMINFLAQIVPALAMEAPSSWLPCPFRSVSNSFLYFLTFWHPQVFQAHLAISLPRPWNHPFLLGVLVPIFGEWYLDTKFQALGVFIAPGMPLPLGLLS